MLIKDIIDRQKGHRQKTQKMQQKMDSALLKHQLLNFDPLTEKNHQQSESFQQL